jgi:hypothetical protein
MLLFQFPAIATVLLASWFCFVPAPLLLALKLVAPVHQDNNPAASERTN